MELEDLKAEWNKRDAALQHTLQTQTALLRGIVADRELRKLRRWSAMSAVELIIYIGFIIFFGATLASSWGRWTVFVPALLLDIWTIVMGALTFAERARVFQWAFLTGQILWWTPFCLVVFWALVGVDLLALSPFMRSFVATNIVVGLVLIPVLLWVAHAIGPWLAKSNTGRSVLDAITGRDLAEARAIAQRLGRFEAEVA